MKKYANQIGYSDVTPYEVVAIKTEKKLEVRAMSCRELPWEREEYPGGFRSHIANQREQKWDITSDENNAIIAIRLGKNGWKDKHGQRYTLDDAPRKFYDYNF